MNKYFVNHMFLCNNNIMYVINVQIRFKRLWIFSSIVKLRQGSDKDCQGMVTKRPLKGKKI